LAVRLSLPPLTQEVMLDPEQGSIRSLVPMAHVASVPASIEFYGKLGFRVLNSVPGAAGEPRWAYLSSGQGPRPGQGPAQLMLARASGPIDADQQAVLFYAYFDDTHAARERLMAAGIEAGPIEYPFWAPRGEFRIVDPDGYTVMVTHT
jgi:catechol 2,3-dioxygenase-like lactoylglutathione lyase family enzyme